MKSVAAAFAIAVLMGVSGLMGCQSDLSQVATQSVAKADEVPANFLPAWKLPGDYKIPGKADSYDDYRAAHPEWYAITVPPSKAGIRTFREWQPMKGVMLGYPGYQNTNVNWSISEMVVQGYQYVHWYVVHDGNSAKSTFNSLLQNKGMSQGAIDTHVTFVNMDLDSIWMIDYGPTPILDPDGGVAFVDARYYHQRLYDDAIPTKFGDLMGVTTYRAELSMEGGNLQTDENGTCYFTQGTYWENADKSQAEIQKILGDYYGCEVFVVLAPLGDGTSHIDMFTKLISKNSFVLGKCTTANCSTTTVSTLNNDADILNAAVLADGTKLTVHKIPMPYQNDFVWRTYTNSTLANNVNLWPVYEGSDAEELEAAEVWAAAAPGWDHVGISSNTIITMGGAMHCVSRNLPEGTYTEWEPNGPEWICDFNDCSDTPVGCDGLTYEGCCDGNLLKWCENNQISTQSCAAGTCGWSSSQGFYNCNTGGGEDPSGLHPKDCNPCEPDCAGKECGGDGCGGSCGGCPAGESCNASGQCEGCTPNCTGKECGGDGCGGFCGNCPTGESCNANGQCDAQTDPCEGLSYEGCCDGDLLKWCESDQVQTMNCPSGTCGWSANQGFYNCETAGGEDPSGLNPKDCNGCTPDCNGKECGGDGCGGSCGGCPVGEACNAGQCVGCTPDCNGKACGSDGCGGSCGSCPPGENCNASFQCVGTTDPCGGMTFEGCCDGSILKWCENEEIVEIDCGDNDPPNDTCGWREDAGYYDCGQTGAEPTGQFPIDCPGPCAPDCAGKACGDDGCGGSCGACPAGEACKNFQCVGCNPDCAGKACGDDGCGGSCGACQAGEKCENFQCVGCNPDCAGKACGDDGCGGSCGACQAGENCENFQCVGCNPDCADKACGDDGCGGSCGDCPGDKPFCVTGVCVENCNPDCTGKQCGDNGCGGSCGKCSADQQCVNGICQQQTLPDTGNQDTACTADCIGKTCGSNGCGGTCGNCPVGFVCNFQGQCIAQPAGTDAGGMDLPEGASGDVADGSKPGGGCSAGSGRTGVPPALGFLLMGLIGAILPRRMRGEG